MKSILFITCLFIVAPATQAAPPPNAIRTQFVIVDKVPHAPKPPFFRNFGELIRWLRYHY